MIPVKAEKKRIRLTQDQWKFVDRWVDELGSIPDKTQADLFAIVADELYKEHKVAISAKNLLSNYLRHKKKLVDAGGTKVASNPDDDRYTLVVYGESGCKTPYLFSNREQMRLKIQELTNARGGTCPKIKIMAPIKFIINLIEQHEPGNAPADEGKV